MNDAHPDHHLWLNGRVWWVAFTFHTGDGRKHRVRKSLGTSDVERARVKRDDVLRGVRVAAPWEAQEEAMRRAGMTDAEAEAWADEVATREAEQWEPPEAWQEEDRKKRER